jgi:hypothetical protein
VDHFLSPILGLVSRAVAIVVTALLCGFAGCGEDEAERRHTEPQRLTAVERAAAASGYDAIRSYCRRLGLHLVAGRAAPGPGAQGRAVEGARAIAALARRKPRAPYLRGQSVRQLAGDTAEDLEGTNCSSRLVVELERGL